MGIALRLSTRDAKLCLSETEDNNVKKSKKGFTLIEMLAVIAIISVLVAIIVPAIGSATNNAKAATDAANLRTVLGLLNIHVVNGEMTVSEIINNTANPNSRLDPDAVLYAVYDGPGFINVYYVNESTATYYSLAYLHEMSLNGADSDALISIGTGRPQVSGDWYKAGVEDKLPSIP